MLVKRDFHDDGKLRLGNRMVFRRVLGIEVLGNVLGGNPVETNNYPLEECIPCIARLSRVWVVLLQGTLIY